jgi:hypothetical protein
MVHNKSNQSGWIRKMKVEVYWNLHKNCFSVRDCKTGRVIEHTDGINLYDVKYVVRQAGRRKVLQEKRKNVHAFVRGYIHDGMISVHDRDQCGKAVYDPYKYTSFINKKSGRPIDESSHASLGLDYNNKPVIYWVNQRG